MFRFYNATLKLFLLLTELNINVKFYYIFVCFCGLFLFSCQHYSNVVDQQGSTDPRRKKFERTKEEEYLAYPSNTPTKKEKNPLLTTLKPSDSKLQLEDYFVSLRDGQVLFQVPSTMKVNVPALVRVRIGTKELGEIKLKEGLESKNIKTENIKISKVVGVRIMTVAPDTFTILPIEHESQVVPSNVFTEWTWSVIPNASGVQTLLFIITTQIEDPQTRKVLIKDFPVKTQEIFVKINPVNSLKQFVYKNFQWIIGIIIGSGVLGWCWRKFTNRSISE